VTLVGGQLHTPAGLHPGKQPPDNLWIGRWVGPRTMWSGEKSFPYRDSNSDPSAVQPIPITLARAEHTCGIEINCECTILSAEVPLIGQKRREYGACGGSIERV
jgi:hypothetical protein